MQVRRQYHEQLDELRREVLRLGALAGELISTGTQAILEIDLALAQQVVTADQSIDELAHAIENRTCQVLALQQPTASDLRYLVSVLRIVHEIERSGDLGVSIAKSARRLYPDPLPPRMRGIIDAMGYQATLQLRVAMDAFADGDAKRAGALDDMDDVMDELERDLYRAIFDLRKGEAKALVRAVQVPLVARFYERIADHAVNIGHRVQFMVTGHFHYEVEEDRGPERS